MRCSLMFISRKDFSKEKGVIALTLRRVYSDQRHHIKECHNGIYYLNFLIKWAEFER